MKRTFLASLALLVLRLATGETLYNGIVLPPEFPPRWSEFPMAVDKYPISPPYLVKPPEVIPIDVGRQLFVDDFLIATNTLKRTFHHPKYYEHNPVLKPERAWEKRNPDNSAAMVFSDGVWFDPADHRFKMWYLAGESEATAYATSRDGIHWRKPNSRGSNIVHPEERDSSTVWLDQNETNAARRFKMSRTVRVSRAATNGFNEWRMQIHFSPDGIHWSPPAATTGPVGDRSTIFWNPFRKVWVYSLRHIYTTNDVVDKRYGYGRRRSYIEGPNLVAAASWKQNEPLRWYDVDRLDPQRADLKTQPQLYNLDCVAYESLMLGLFTVWRGQPADRQKPNDVVLGYSRDGFYWARPDRSAFLPISDHQGDWNANNVQSAGGGCLVVGDKLYFYVSGRAGNREGNRPGVQSTGLAILRRDGFASMDATNTTGVLTTRPVRFSGKHLFVNVDDPKGELRVEVLSQTGEILATSKPLKSDKTRKEIHWRGIQDLSAFARQPVRFRFHLKNGSLYSFWVSPEKAGYSHGYVAAGGSGFSSDVDSGKKGAR